MLRRGNEMTVPVPTDEQARVELKLVGGGTWSHRPPNSHQVLRVFEGEAYITEEGCANDYFLHTGEALELPAHRLIVVQGHPETTIAVEEHLN